MCRRAALAPPNGLRAGLLVGLLLTVTGCSLPGGDSPADKLTPPELGACHALEIDDLSPHSDDSEPVPCTQQHTAQTFLVATLPARTGSSYTSTAHGKYVYGLCSKAFVRFLGGDESLAMRSQLSWSWFRASEDGWKRGARWFRCDVVGGPDWASALTALPRTAKGLLIGPTRDEWMTCAVGATVKGSHKVSCDQAHQWRAVTTIKLGQPDDPYPGDRISEVRSRDYCSDSVSASLGYPPDFEFGYTWFHEAEWKAGNRRAICWAKTDK